MKDQFYKRNLKTHFVAILRELDTSYVLDYLFQEDVLEMDDYEEILHMNKSDGRRETARYLLLHLLQCPPERTPVQALIKALVSTNTYHLAILLGWEEKKRPATRSQTEHHPSSSHEDSESSPFKTPSTHNSSPSRSIHGKRLFHEHDDKCEPTAKQSKNAK